MIIAEIGLNHLGSASLAEEYIDRLANTDIDGITLQIREREYYIKPEKEVYKLSRKNYLQLSNRIHNCGKKFGAAIADIDYIDYLESINTDFYKIIRNDITNENLTKKLIDTGKKIIVSTGLSSNNDIEIFMAKYKDNKNIVLNHTQLSYNVDDCNLAAIEKIREKYGCSVSYGSHCENNITLYMALSYSPSDILFYVKGNEEVKYPDDKHAIILDDVKEVSKNLKSLKNAIGTGVKQKMINKIERAK